MGYEFCAVEKNGHVLEVTINRPDRYNAVHPPANDELAKIFDDFTNDDDLWVAILTGTGDKAFCSGNDLKYQGGGGKMWIPDSGFGGLTNRYDLDKPVIAALNGLALGGGFEIVLACDLAIAAEHAKVGLPEPKIGLFAGAGGVQMLREQIGRRAANEMLFTGRHIEAQEALEKGLLNEIVPADQLMTRARALAAEICECSPMAIRTTKRILNDVNRIDGYADKMALSTPAMVALGKSEDMMEGIQSFVQKRKPEWKNK